MLERFHEAVARAGKDRDTATALVLLDAADPGHEASYKAELVEVLAFVDDLAAAEHGEVARDAAPIATLAPIAHTLGVRWLVDRYVSMVVARQQKVIDLLDHQQQSYDLVAAHRDVVTAARDVARSWPGPGGRRRSPPRSRRSTSSAPTRTSPPAARAIAGGGTPADWARLARTLRGAATAAIPPPRSRSAGPGWPASPTMPTLLAAAAAAAAAVGRVEQPIRLYEAARAHAPGDRPARPPPGPALPPAPGPASPRAGGRCAARAELDRLETVLRRRRRRFGAGAWKPTTPPRLITAGRGRLGHGDVAGARDLLQRSLALEPGRPAPTRPWRRSRSSSATGPTPSAGSPPGSSCRTTSPRPPTSTPS